MDGFASDMSVCFRLVAEYIVVLSTTLLFVHSDLLDTKNAVWAWCSVAVLGGLRPALSVSVSTLVVVGACEHFGSKVVRR